MFLAAWKIILLGFPSKFIILRRPSLILLAQMNMISSLGFKIQVVLRCAWELALPPQYKPFFERTLLRVEEKPFVSEKNFLLWNEN